MASVRKRDPKDPNSPWVVEYTDAGGKRRRATPKSGLKKDADALRRKVESELEQGFHVAKSQTCTFAEAIELWLDRCERRVKAEDRLRPRTLRNYRSTVKHHIRPQLGPKLVRDLTFRALQDWIDQLAYDRKRPRKFATLTNAAMIVGSVLNDARLRGLVGRNVLDGDELRIPGRDATPRAIPSKDELRRCLTRSGTVVQGGFALWQRPCLFTAIYAGLRQGELRALRWRDVDLDAGVIRVRAAADDRGRVDRPKTMAGFRDVPIAPVLDHTLRDWRETTAFGKDEDLVFVTREGRMVVPTSMNQSWARLQHRVLEGKALSTNTVKGRYRFHDLRHVAASLFIEIGLPPKRIQTIMGHSSITMTFDLYGHLFEDADVVRAAMARLGSDLIAA